MYLVPLHHTKLTKLLRLVAYPTQRCGHRCRSRTTFTSDRWAFLFIAPRFPKKYGAEKRLFTIALTFLITNARAISSLALALLSSRSRLPCPHRTHARRAYPLHAQRRVSFRARVHRELRFARRMEHGRRRRGGRSLI